MERVNDLANRLAESFSSYNFKKTETDRISSQRDITYPWRAVVGHGDGRGIDFQFRLSSKEISWIQLRHCERFDDIFNSNFEYSRNVREAQFKFPIWIILALPRAKFNWKTRSFF